MDDNIYLQLTKEFNHGRLRTIISSGQAVVLHRLAVMSKDGDWILREEEESFDHVLGVLAARGAGYRFGAPLDVRWHRGGWSSHFDFQQENLRIRTDFFSRPPRLSAAERDRLWQDHASKDPAFLGARDLAEIKKTNREKDYPVIGELARRMVDLHDQILYSRSALDLLALAEEHPDLVISLRPQRPLLAAIGQGRDTLENALDAERRALMRANEKRLMAYLDAARPWSARWPSLVPRLASLPLREAHVLLVGEAEGCLPFSVELPS